MGTKPVPTSTMQTEPAAVIGAITTIVTAVIALLVAFGVDLSDDQQKAILGVIAAVAPIIAALVIRNKVYSPATVQEEVNKAAVSGVAADVAPPPPVPGDVPRDRWGVNRDKDAPTV